MATKITSLTPSNVAALRETHRDAIASGNLEVNATTAIWQVNATAALANLEAIMSALPSTGHPRASLHAVRRKLEKEATRQAKLRQAAAVAAGVATGTLQVVREDVIEIDGEKLADQLDKTGHPAAAEIRAMTTKEDTTTPLPFDSKFEFLLDQQPDNLFEPVGRDDSKLRCKACTEIVPRHERRTHFDNHRAYRAANTGGTKMATTKTKQPKTTAKDLGVPKEYLSESGTFRVGMDARLKSDLINAILDLPAGGALVPWSKSKAEAMFAKFPQWSKFLDRKREIVAAKAKAAETKAAEKAEREKAKAAEKKQAKTGGKNMAEQVAAEQAEHDATVGKPNGGDLAKNDVQPDPKPAPRAKSGRGRK